MIEPAIEVKNLSKVYNINHEQKASAGNITLVDTLSSVIRKPIELITGQTLEKEKFWALKSVNFNIEKGDVVGVIGRNGSGKSTLLKILSRIVEPTEGEIIMRGKVASLLEVGTGFHPELSGRENIFFNGAILGMSKKEIRAKFDEIVEFSEVERFLDTPVKFYSSGMYVRLAFAVAAHLDPDVLIVDEVLAVGDAAFQKKCLAKMKDVAGQGRTVIFVSHSMGSVKQLCTKAILLKEGKIIDQGEVGPVIENYMQGTLSMIKSDKALEINVGKTGLKFYDFSLNDLKLEDNPHIYSGEPMNLGAKYKAEETGGDLCVGFSLKSQTHGVYVYYSHSHLEGIKHSVDKKGYVSAKLQLPHLAAGNYVLEFQVWVDGKHYVQDREVSDILVLPVPMFGTQAVMESFPAVVMTNTDWVIK